MRRVLETIQWIVSLSNAHEARQPPDALLVHKVPFVAQLPGHLPHTMERRVKELLVDQQHQRKVHLGLALRLVVKR